MSNELYRQSVPGAVTPEDVTLIPGRTGDAERERAVGWLNDCHAAGRLDDSELEIRRTHALSAQTKQDLDVLMSDLPPYPIPRKLRKDSETPLRKWLGTGSVGLAIVILIGCFLSVCTSIVPAVILVGSGDSTAANAAGAVFIVAGVVAVIGMIFWAVKVWDD